MNVRFSQPCAELLVVRPGRVLTHIVPADRLREDFTIGRRQIVHARERGQTVLDIRQVVMVATRRGVGSNQFVVFIARPPAHASTAS